MNICCCLGHFYLEQVRQEKQHCLETEDDYTEANKRISALRITDIDLQGKDILITLARPGLLIGRHGENINQLREYLSRRIKFNHLNVEENKVVGWIYVMSPEDAAHAIYGY